MDEATGHGDDLEPPAGSRPVRADARRNVDALLAAALAVFTAAGVDAPVRAIAAAAGVGVGTVYRHFPQRSDLVIAVFRREVDACAAAATALAAEHRPGDALERWLQRFATFIAAKRGLAAALQSGNPAFDALPAYFDAHLRAALRTLLDTAIAAGEARDDVAPDDLLRAVAGLVSAAPDGPARAARMVALLADGLRVGPRAGVVR